MAIDIYASSTLDGLEPEEQKLADLINNYRSQNGLPPIPLSRVLTIVANRHVLDLAENFVTPPSNLHSWSWGTFDLNNRATYPNMWEAPQRLGTGYPGYGYENAHGGSPGYVATADSAFDGWRNSSPPQTIFLIGWIRTIN